MEIGQRVRHSGYVIQRLRDNWNSCGREPQKSRYKDHLDKENARRGTVTAILQADHSRGVSSGLEITWDDGPVSRCLSYMVIPAQD